MKTSDRARLSDDARAFLADLEFRLADGAPPRLCIASRSTGRESMAVRPGPWRFEGRRSLGDYGIEDGGGRKHRTRCFGLPAAFEERFGRQPSAAEWDGIADAVLAAAKESPEVATFAAALDHDALRAFGQVPIDRSGSDDPYLWISGTDPMACAVKRFALRFPLLAGLVTNGFDAEGDTVEEAYANLTREFAEKGFERENRFGAERTGPVPAGLLKRIDGVMPPDGFRVLDQEALLQAADGIGLACRLPVGCLPATSRGWMALFGAGTTFDMLTKDAADDRDVVAAIEDGDGCALDFTAEELASAFDPAKGRWEDVPAMSLGDAFLAAGDLARHGVRLAGYGDWLAEEERRRFPFEDAPAGVRAIDFSDLKAALVRDGFAATLRQAQADDEGGRA